MNRSALLRVARTCSVFGAENRESERRKSRHGYATRALFVAIFFVVPSGHAALAQPPAEDLLPCQSLASERSWVTFGMVLGRIHVLNAQLGQSLSAQNDNPELGVRESFSINAGSDEAVVRYEIQTSDLELVLDFPAPDCLKIVKTPRTPNGGSAVYLEQPRQGPIEMTVGQGKQRKTFRSESFWHLALQHREVCEQHLLPILHCLRVGWQLDRTADGIEASLLRLAREQRLPEEARWAALVKKLGGGKFSERRAAERELCRSGQAVVAYLTRLDRRELDAEQRERIGRVIRNLVAPSDDTPQRVALWLSGDEAVWQALASRENLRVHTQAVAHLARLRGEPVESASVIRTARDPATTIPR